MCPRGASTFGKKRIPRRGEDRNPRLVWKRCPRGGKQRCAQGRAGPADSGRSELPGGRHPGPGPQAGGPPVPDAIPGQRPTGSGEAEGQRLGVPAGTDGRGSRRYAAYPQAAHDPGTDRHRSGSEGRERFIGHALSAARRVCRGTWHWRTCRRVARPQPRRAVRTRSCRPTRFPKRRRQSRRSPRSMRPSPSWRGWSST